jgi:hypothetical protein
VGFRRDAFVICHIEHDVKCIGQSRGYKARAGIASVFSSALPTQRHGNDYEK